MRKIIMVLLSLVCCVALQARAQVYDSKYVSMVAPMDEAIDRSNNAYRDVNSAGDVEINTAADERYRQMTTDMNNANIRHFDNFMNSTLQSPEMNQTSE